MIVAWFRSHHRIRGINWTFSGRDGFQEQAIHILIDSFSSTHITNPAGAWPALSLAPSHVMGRKVLCSILPKTALGRCHLPPHPP